MQTEPFVDHSMIKSFAEEKVNLPRDDAQAYRDQVNRLRDRLAAHIDKHPAFDLVKMLHAGSVAKGTALRTVNDLDVAVYVRKAAVPKGEDDRGLVSWLAARLREANPNMKAEQFDDSQPHCVTVQFRGSGLDVDVVPVLTDTDDDFGYLVDKTTGDRMLTSIPRHLEFIRARKKKNPDHYGQVVRLAKWWAKQQKDTDQSFKCKSFMLELIVAYLADRGADLSDYPSALEVMFSYIVRSNVAERISFSDYYSNAELPDATGAAVEIFDPVNPQNNIASRYSAADRDRLVRAAEQAGDAISEARYATTKGRAVECWQVVLGPSFRG